MSPPISAPPRPTLAVPPQPRWRVGGSFVSVMPHLWAWPLLLSLMFVGGVMGWLRSVELADLDSQRAEMISDALSLEAQVSNRLDAEAARLRTLADVIKAENLSDNAFAQHALVLDGLRRFWISVTWLDAKGRIVVQVPDDSMPAHSSARSGADERGLAGHLSAPLQDWGGKPAGLLVARYMPAEVLRQKVPWWLARKYDIRLVDELGEVIASTIDGPRLARQAWYRVPAGPSLPQAFLELSARETIKPWWRTLPVVLMSGFVLLIGGASWMLRRQMQGVSRAEEAWRTEAAWRTAMEDSLAVGIRARDLEGRLVYVNKTMADMLGYQPEELIGAMPPMPYWPSQELDQAMQRHLRNMAGQAPSEGYESRWQHRDGQILEVVVLEAPLVDAKGQHIGWMASILNVTERKRLEERERKQADTMAHHSRLTMLGEVASTLAHELNQPLSAIASYNAGVLNSLSREPGSDPALLIALKRMGEQASHAGRIVKRIREFLTRREPQREPCDLNQVVASAVALLSREIARHGIAVTTELDASLPRVMADPILIEQVAANLVRNACDELAHTDQPRRVHIQTLLGAGGRFAKVVVTDSGPGLGGRSIDQLCQPFYSTKSDGMGMGLAICRSIIELHYGGLDAEEVIGGGASLSFTVPCLRPEDLEEPA
ncbi:PAS domain S-box protein [Aquabacterium sp.]|uniref:sensor histidine kinase n=1 Tax=Aquabacterium sp. TaxID=1872578 RepID=UPI0024873C56|nr:PAS domain S-box protein [Aquabacterium sp.]MDI1261376.1 PAS domain S-box protein [Aquabacterium sp.]